MATPDADELMALDPMKLKSMEGFMGELAPPTEASTSCPTSTSPSRATTPRLSKGAADMSSRDVDEVHVSSVMVDRVLEDALQGEQRGPASPKRKAKAGKKKDEKKGLVLSIPAVQQPAAPQSPSKRTTFGASQGWRTPTASPQNQTNGFRSPDRAPLVNRCSVQWTPCSSPFGEDRFAMSPDAAGLPPSPFHANAERSLPFCPDEGYGEFRPGIPPPPNGPPPPQPGPYDPQWGQGCQGWECWDEGVDTPNNMNASMPRYSNECWGANCEPAWSPSMQQMNQGCGGWGDGMPLNRKGRGLGGKKKPEKLAAFLPENASSRTTPKSDATSTPSARATPTAGRLPNQYSGMQFSYAVSAAPPPPPSQQYKKAATPSSRTSSKDMAPRKPDHFAEVCKLILSETCELRLRGYENMPYED